LCFSLMYIFHHHAYDHIFRPFLYTPTLLIKGFIPCQSMWDLWWTQSQWKRFFFECFVFPIGMSPQMLHVHSFTYQHYTSQTKKALFFKLLTLRKPIIKIAPRPKLTNK
jgi:hypothetical protein